MDARTTRQDEAESAGHRARLRKRLLDAGPDDLRMDMPMIVDFAPSPDGDLVPQWRPAG